MATVETIDVHRARLAEEEEEKEVRVFRLRGGATEVEISSFGGTIVALRVPDKHQVVADVALGCAGGAAAWETQKHPYFGSTVGRYCNRIAGASFKLQKSTVKVTANERGVTCLHGGARGFSHRVWSVARAGVENGAAVLALERVSPDGEEGFPGELHCTAEYSVDAKSGALRMVFRARLADGCRTPTVVSMTNHVYLNLGGENCGRDIRNHVLAIKASQTTCMDPATLIPTGELAPVAGTCLDFLKPHAIGERIQEALDGRGYDHNFVVDGYDCMSGRLQHIARLTDPVSGRVLDVSTTQPGVQLYTGNWLDDADVVAKGAGIGRYSRWAGLCLETQHHPDSPNHPNFPSTTLHPGEEYCEETLFAFSYDAC